jgi:hypothetical protein
LAAERPKQARRARAMSEREAGMMDIFGREGVRSSTLLEGSRTREAELSKVGTS